MPSSGRETLVDDVWCAFLSAGRVIHARARLGASSGGLTMPRVTLLRLIVHRGRSSSKELAAALGVSTADLPGLLEKLETDALVTRERGTTDRRVVYVEATANGRRKLESLRRAAMRELEAEFVDWNSRDLRNLRDLLVRIGHPTLGSPSAPRNPLVTVVRGRSRL